MQNELMQSRDEVRNLAEHLENLLEKERVRISADLHDDLGQQLTALNMEVAWLKNYSNHPPDEIKERLTSMSHIILSSIETIQNITTSLRPGIIDDLGLPAAVEWQLEEFSRRSEIDFYFNSQPEEFKISNTISILVFRIIQEALTNIIRHAQATSVRLELNYHDNMLYLSIADNGIGISENDIKNSRSFGIISMRERVRSCQGSFSISGNSGQGTKIVITLPQIPEND